MAKLIMMDTPADIPAHAPSKVGEMLAAGVAGPTAEEGVGVSEDEKVGGIVGAGGTGKQSVCPGLLVVPEGQGSQTAAPLSIEIKPSRHGEQADASDAPTNGFAVPGSHILQASIVLHVPAGHGGPHTGDPAGVCEPVAQGVHDELPGAENVPAAHCTIGQGGGPPAQL